MKITGIIPARYDSTRFPGKPLATIAGVSMIQRVYQRAKLANIDRIIVATDDERIAAHVRTFGEVVMTRSDHRTGTDRCAEVVELLHLKGIVVNIQGDEPLVSPKQIEAVADFLVKHTDTYIATVVHPNITREAIENSNVVKAFVVGQGDDKYAADFSRGQSKSGMTVPNLSYQMCKHIGMYAFRAESLPILSDLPNGTFELMLSLEQLRWLENGYRIGVVESTEETIGVDAPEDIAKVVHLLNI